MIVSLQRTGSVDLVVTAPPSKSYTHRALIIGALASGTTTILQPLYAQDTRLTINALRMLGVPITVNPDHVIITGCNGRFPTRDTTILDLDNSGTSLRLLTSLALLCSHPVILTGSQRMQERPIGPLAQALRCLGGTIDFLKNEGYPPLKVSGYLQGGGVLWTERSAASSFLHFSLLLPMQKQKLQW